MTENVSVGPKKQPAAAECIGCWEVYSYSTSLLHSIAADWEAQTLYFYFFGGAPTNETLDVQI